MGGQMLTESLQPADGGSFENRNFGDPDSPPPPSCGVGLLRQLTRQVTPGFSPFSVIGDQNFNFFVLLPPFLIQWEVAILGPSWYRFPHFVEFFFLGGGPFIGMTMHSQTTSLSWSDYVP